MARAQWVSEEIMDMILKSMMPANRLAVEVSLHTGLRIGDVLALRTDTVQRTARPYVRDSKTGKLHRISLPFELRAALLAGAGKVYVFPGRLDPLKHRSRAAVYKDMRQAVEVVKRAGWVEKGAQISPHSARKVAAVRAFQKGGFPAAQALLQHDQDHPMVTMVYALSDRPESLPPLSRRRKSSKRAMSRRRAQKGHS